MNQRRRSRPTHRSRLRWWLFGATAGAVAAFSVIVPAAPAHAHADLESSSPANGAVLDSAPHHVVITFTEEVDFALGRVDLFSEHKTTELGAPARRADEAATYTWALPELADGGYLIGWRAVSLDGHPISGTFTFVVGSGAAINPNALSAVGGGSRTVGVLAGVARFLAFAGFALLLGGSVVGAWIHSGMTAARARSVGIVGGIVLVVGSLAAFVLQGPYTAATGLGDVFDTNLWREVADTRLGVALLVRTACAGVGIVALIAARRAASNERRIGSVPALVTAGAGCVAACSFGMSGHPNTGRWIPLAFVFDVVHVLAMAAWLGGLVVLALATLRPHVADVADVHEEIVGVERFSRLATFAIALIAVSGAGQALRQLDPVSNLWHTNYGRLLILKLALVAGVLAIAFFSRRLAERHRRVGDEAELAFTNRYRLRRLVIGELAIAAGVLGVTAMLVNTAPERAVAAQVDFRQTVAAGDLQLEVVVAPATRGVNEITVTVLGADTEPLEVMELTGRGQPPDQGLAALEIVLKRTAVGTYRATFPFTTAGSWGLEFRALVTDIDEASGTVTVPVA